MVRGHPGGEERVRRCLSVEAPSSPPQRLESLNNRSRRGSLFPRFLLSIDGVQHELGLLQCLDRRLLGYAEHDGMIRQSQV